MKTDKVGHQVELLGNKSNLALSQTAGPFGRHGLLACIRLGFFNLLVYHAGVTSFMGHQHLISDSSLQNYSSCQMDGRCWCHVFKPCHRFAFGLKIPTHSNPS